MNRPASLLLLALSACNGDGADSTPLKGGETCTALSAGTWTFSGSAFGMGDETMEGDVLVDVDGCSFTISDWTMMMDDLPSGGVLDGDAVQLDGLNSYWRSCTGTATDENTAAGTCTDDGQDWMMAFPG